MDAATTNRRDYGDAVLDVLRRSSGWVSGRVLADATGLSTRDVRAVVHCLVVERGVGNLITKSGAAGGYKLADDDDEIDACRAQLAALSGSIDARTRAYRQHVERRRQPAGDENNQLTLGV